MKHQSAQWDGDQFTRGIFNEISPEAYQALSPAVRTWIHQVAEVVSHPKSHQVKHKLGLMIGTEALTVISDERTGYCPPRKPFWSFDFHYGNVDRYPQIDWLERVRKAVK